jgi:hypothetical protein
MYQYCSTVLSNLYRSCITCDGAYGGGGGGCSCSNENENNYYIDPIELLIIPTNKE